MNHPTKLFGTIGLIAVYLSASYFVGEFAYIAVLVVLVVAWLFRITFPLLYRLEQQFSRRESRQDIDPDE
ncbi:hypothetical protein Enr13x_58870 [Stieleria neptunia]|uniref:Uncharacterized protein n=1 Tax=Stieleria neptunia TaxID=2527979 RepID=A0A518HYR0_9BACT|nr:hypothetical protein [Stieleria neptunia]QDV45983.1 hypothetical protein Enr13x_58870 [Stieleria neptunia]